MVGTVSVNAQSIGLIITCRTYLVGTKAICHCPPLFLEDFLLGLLHDQKPLVAFIAELWPWMNSTGDSMVLTALRIMGIGWAAG
jgi:hypothetical protein